MDHKPWVIRVYCTGDDPLHRNRRASVIEFTYADDAPEYPGGEWWADKVMTRLGWRAHRETLRRAEARRRSGESSGGLAELADIVQEVAEEMGLNSDESIANQKLIGDRGELLAVGPASPGGMPEHVTFVMECKLCGLNIQARDQRITPVLDTLREEGLKDISLTALAAILR